MTWDTLDTTVEWDCRRCERRIRVQASVSHLDATGATDQGARILLHCDCMAERDRWGDRTDTAEDAEAEAERYAIEEAWEQWERKFGECDGCRRPAFACCCP